MTDSCATCSYYIHGACHFHPPSMDSAIQSSFSGWPPVKSTDWCGNWAPGIAINSCSSCVYYFTSGCHRNIPQVGVNPQATFSGWPNVLSSDWCGHWDSIIPSFQHPMAWYFGTDLPTSIPNFGNDGDWYVLQSANIPSLWSKVSGAWIIIQSI